MRTNLLTKTFFCFLALLCISSCESSPELVEDSQQESLDPAFEELLVAIDSFEQENNFNIDSPTRKINWGFVVGCDSVPLVLFGSVGMWGVGLGIGILNSLYSAFFEAGYTEVVPDPENTTTFFPDTQIADNAGALHNAVICDIFEEKDEEEEEIAEMSDWELFCTVRDAVLEYLPEESLGITEREFQQMMNTIPDPRVYSDYDSYESAVLTMHPELQNELTVFYRVLPTVLAQDTEVLTESYVQGVTEIISNSSIPNDSKQGLISGILVQKASRFLWYE